MQREAAAKTEEKEGNGDSDDNEETGGGKDDWYSSDDEVEDNNLTEVLKNLSSTKVIIYLYACNSRFYNKIYLSCTIKHKLVLAAGSTDIFMPYIVLISMAILLGWNYVSVHMN